MFDVGWSEVLLIIVVILLLFGAKRIPELMRSIGKGVHELKKGMQGLDAEEPKQDAKADKPVKAEKTDSEPKA
jgi:sec-independent protein translocase protein TatA